MCTVNTYSDSQRVGAFSFAVYVVNNEISLIEIETARRLFNIIYKRITFFEIMLAPFQSNRFEKRHRFSFIIILLILLLN